jgi:hypothetical protein
MSGQQEQALVGAPIINLKPVGSKFIRTTYPNLSVSSERHMTMTTMEVVGHSQGQDLFGNNIFVEQLKPVEQSIAEATHFWINNNTTILYSVAEQRVPVAMRIGAYELIFDKSSIKFEIEDNKIIVKSAFNAPVPEETTVEVLAAPESSNEEIAEENGATQ